MAYQEPANTCVTRTNGGPMECNSAWAASAAIKSLGARGKWSEATTRHQPKYIILKTSKLALMY